MLYPTRSHWVNPIHVTKTIVNYHLMSGKPLKTHQHMRGSFLYRLTVTNNIDQYTLITCDLWVVLGWIPTPLNSVASGCSAMPHAEPCWAPWLLPRCERSNLTRARNFNDMHGLLLISQRKKPNSPRNLMLSHVGLQQNMWFSNKITIYWRCRRPWARQSL